MKFFKPVGRRLILLIGAQTAIVAWLVWSIYGVVSRLQLNDAAAHEELKRILWVGVAGTLVTMLLGLAVHRAVVPRIQRLLKTVRRFQDTGVNQAVPDDANDEIAVLANAINLGFVAIANREREREQFLAIVAHELKTPLASIQGYASLLVGHPERNVLVPRALEIIERQSWRLNRLIEGLFLSMQARSGDLEFHPAPMDLSALVVGLSNELKTNGSKDAFSFKIKDQVRVLADEMLLEHACWSLLTCASALSDRDSSVLVQLDASEGRATLVIDVQKSIRSAADIDMVFTPFKAIQYETGSGARAAVGLYLSKEIVRIHGGRLQVHDVTNRGAEFVMELPS